MKKILEKVSGALSYLKEKSLGFLVFLSLMVLSIIPFLSDLYTPETKDTPTDIPNTCIKQYRLGGAIPGKNDCTRKAITTHGGMGGYHCTGSQGHIWAESYCNLNEASTVYQEKGITGFNYDGVPNFNTEHSDYHDYTVVNSCSKLKTNCSRKKVYEQLKKFPAPLSEGITIVDEQKSYAWPVGYVRHEVDDSSYTITNVTLDQHLLSFGIVERSVIEDKETVSLVTRGRGTGPFPYLNEVLSDPLWSSVDENIFY